MRPVKKNSASLTKIEPLEKYQRVLVENFCLNLGAKA